jgi:tetratricopeptide (TPR) repeat protein
MREARATGLSKSARPGIWAVVGLVLLAVCSIAPARAFQSSGAQQSNLRWYDAYDRGIAAVKEGNWKLAEQLLTDAKARGPRQQSARTLFYGDTYRPFVPDYYLGIVYLRTDRADEADKAFGSASVVAGNIREFANLPTLRAEALKLAAAKTAAAAPKPPSGITTTPTPNPDGEPKSTSPAPVTTPPAGVPDSTTQTAGGGAVAQPPLPAPSQRPSAVVPPIGKPGTTSPYTPTPVGGGKEPVGGRTPAGGLAPKDAYALWREGLRQFLVGQYGDAVATLERAASTPGAPPEASLYLACARVGAALSGRGDATTLALAREEFAGFAASNALDADDRRYISPRILAQLQAR